MPHPPGNVARGLFDEKVEHESRCSGEGVPKYVPAISTFFLECMYITGAFSGVGGRIFFLISMSLYKFQINTYQVTIYCKWLFLRLTSAGLPTGIPFLILSCVST